MFRLADSVIFNCAMQNRRMTTNGVGLLNIRPPVLTPYSDGSLLVSFKTRYTTKPKSGAPI